MNLPTATTSGAVGASRPRAAWAQARRVGPSGPPPADAAVRGRPARERHVAPQSHSGAGLLGWNGSWSLAGIWPRNGAKATARPRDRCRRVRARSVL